ncbi:MAG TPA: DoxX family protein [Pseudonocardia sp.]|nr:DoxX family protein [Pseudonocardia sp.]
MSESASLVAGVARPSKPWHVTLWVLQVLAAAMFLLAGYLKLSGSPDMVALFQAIGVGQWFRYLTGTLEALGAIALLIPRLRALGALGLVGVMIGALITDLFVVDISPVSALINLFVVAFIGWGRRGELRALLPRS